MSVLIRHALAPMLGICLAATAVTATMAPVQAQSAHPRSLGSVAPHAKSKAAPQVNWDKCGKWVPKKARCGNIRTLADPLRPKLGKQRVAFEFYRRSDKSRKSLGTLVAQEGGPGYPTTASRGYFRGLFRPMDNRRDVLLVDQRGTGKSGAIRCKPLQRAKLPYIQAVTACGKQLGERADTYGTAYGADDLAQVLDALDIGRIDLYGDSYGTFFAQTFALRHQDRVRTLVVDASYPVSGQDPWWRDTNRAIQDALTRVCNRDSRCSKLAGSPVRRLRTVAERVHHHPVRARAYDSEGNRRKITLDGVSLALVTAYATYGTTIYRELDAAVRAFRHGYEAPLTRMVAENVFDDFSGGAVKYYSSGEYVAVICNDYPQLWDVSLPPGPQRRQQFQDALSDVKQNDPNGFNPFRVDDWVASGWTEPRTCIGWPSPTDTLLPEEPGTTYPYVPTLVLSGDLDTVTSPEGGLDVADRFPDAKFVSVPNSGHVVALGDRQGCAAGIVVHFIRTGGTLGDTSCTSEYVPVRAVPTFSPTSDGLDAARQGKKVQSSVADRRVVAAAMYSASDVPGRWWNNYTGDGVGLHGGTYSYRGSSLVKFQLQKYKLFKDVSVTGRFRWNRDTGAMRANLRVDGPGGRDGRLVGRWNDRDPSARAKVTGSLGGRPVKLATHAP